jgi:hypothetical protein
MNFNDNDHFFFCSRTIMRQGYYFALKYLYPPEASKTF